MQLAVRTSAASRPASGPELLDKELIQMNVIAQAIAERRLLEFYYDGLPRLVVPAIYGYTTTGKASLRGYQVGGSTRSASKSFWRLFSIGKATSVRLSPETFDSYPPGYRASDRAFTAVIARL